ncbi:MAG: serine/threonine protein kinase [Nitrospinaceae bacterium]|nr:MAG: serine/threonine protein kinase [Nitrospinaceae bacterium]
MNPSKITEFNLPAGKSIAGKYKVLSRLGSGWEGEVYKIYEVKTGIEKAAKLFYPQRNLRGKSAKRYAQKLHKLRQCSLLIQYHTQEEIIYHKFPVTVLVSEYVEGVLLSEFLLNFPGKKLDPYKALHLLHALAKGIEEIHLRNEYHGDLHSDNIIVNKFGLNFELKLLDLFHYGAARPEFLRDDLIGLINIFYEVLGGSKNYSKHPQAIKYICCGLKKSMIVKKFKTVSQLREHLEVMEWTF